MVETRELASVTGRTLRGDLQEDRVIIAISCY